MILVINTSGAGLEFVLDDKYKHVNVEKQSIALPVEAEKFLTECGAKWSDITAIGVVVGPGSFTGIRLGIAYAKGLALGSAAHAIGTARAMEMGPVEGAMSSLAIAVAGLLTVVAASFFAPFA